MSFSSFERKGEFTDVHIKAAPVAITGLGDEPKRMVTAVINTDGKLKVTAWRVTDESQITKHVTRFGDKASLTSIASLGEERVVTAIRDDAGKLKLNVWNVSEGGNITPKGEKLGGEVSKISMCRVGQTNRVATAVRAGNGSFKLILWEIDAAGEISRKDERDGGAVQELSLCNLPGSNRLVAGVIGSSNKIKVILFSVSSGGELNRLDDAAAEAFVTNVAVTPMSADHVLTFTRSVPGHLAIPAWNVKGMNTIEFLILDTQPAFIKKNIAAARITNNKIVSVVRDNDGNLKLDAWALSGQPSSHMVNLGTDGGGAVSQVDVTRLKDHPESSGTTQIRRLAVAVRDSAGKLKIVVWHLVTRSPN